MMITMAPPRPSPPGCPSEDASDEYSRHLRRWLTPGLAAAAEARSCLRAAIRAWGLRVDVDVVVLLVSELVTNASTHGQPARAVTGELSEAVARGDGQRWQSA